MIRHLGNIQPGLDYEEHDGVLNAKRTSPIFNGNTTIFTGIYSATGNSTIFVAPAYNRFFVQNLHVSSLGRSEVEFRSGATTLIPFTSLSTTSRFAVYYGRDGLPSRAQADALVANLNGGATISVMANVRYAP